MLFVMMPHDGAPPPAVRPTEPWTLIRFLHLTGVTFFVGGQLLLVVAVAPVLRRAPDDYSMCAVARRFGIAGALALAVVIATGVAMASHYGIWDDPVLRAKLAMLVLIGALVPLHIISARTRALSAALVASSVFVVWLGVELTYG